ncbi:MAG: prenyltransferase [bacterium]
MKEKIKIWIQAIRLYSFTTTFLPMLIGFACLPHADWLLAALIMACVFIAHAGINMINDYYDYIYGVDLEHTRGSSRMLVNKQLTPPAMLNASLGCFLASALLGVGIVFYTQRYFLLVVGGVALLIGYFYSATRLQLKRYGLGDIGVLISTGPLITSGIVYAQTGAWPIFPAIVGLLPGLLAVDVLHTNNLRDVESDKKAGLWNAAHIKGFGIAYWWCLLGAAYLIQFWMIWQGHLPSYTLVTLLLLTFLHPRISIERMALGHLLFNSVVALALFLR